VRHYAIWMADRTASGWARPRLVKELDLERDAWRPTASRGGTVYFSSNGVWRARRAGTGFSPPEIVTTSAGVSPGGHACISPDETFLITSATEGSGAHGGWDLYVTWRNGDSTWAASRNLGPPVNTAAHEDFGCVSPDGRTFFFTRLRTGAGGQTEGADIYSIGADFLSSRKNQPASFLRDTTSSRRSVTSRE